MYIAKHKNEFNQGWAYYADNVYTVGSPLAVNNAKVQITNDGAGGATEESYLPEGSASLWSSDKIQSFVLGAAYDVRVDFTCDPAGVSDFGELIFDIGDGAPDIPIVQRTVSFAKTGASLISVTTALFSLATFLANGCKIYFDTSGSGDSIDIYDIAVFIKKDF